MTGETRWLRGVARKFQHGLYTAEKGMVRHSRATLSQRLIKADNMVRVDILLENMFLAVISAVHLVCGRTFGLHGFVPDLLGFYSCNYSTGFHSTDSLCPIDELSTCHVTHTDMSFVESLSNTVALMSTRVSFELPVQLSRVIASSL